MNQDQPSWWVVHKGLILAAPFFVVMAVLISPILILSVAWDAWERKK